MKISEMDMWEAQDNARLGFRFKDSQEYLDSKYSQRKRLEIRELNFHSKSFILTDTLLIENWPILEEIDCSDNHLDSLIIKNCPRLKKINAHDSELTSFTINGCFEVNHLDLAHHNMLTSLDFLVNLSKEKLIYLHIYGNNFTPQDLSIFSEFINLEELYIGDGRFFGSLESLKNCLKLKELLIGDTDVDTGLEYLPASLELITYSGKLSKELQDYKLEIYSDHYDYQAWRKDHLDLIANSQEIVELETSLNNLNLASSNGNPHNQATSQGLEIFIFETEEKVKELRRENQEYYQAKQEIPPKSN